MPTIREVAQLAGVSDMTVSRVVNKHPNVRPKTRAAVEAAVAALNYSPNPAARALATADHARIGLLHRHPNPAALGELLVHLVEELARSNASLTVHKVEADASFDAILRELVSDGVQGALLAPPLGDEPVLLDLLRGRGIVPVALGLTGAPSVTSVGIDDREAAREMTAHLISLGHRRIGFIKGNPDHAATSLRLDGYLAALDGAAISPDDQLIVEGAFTYQSGLTAAERLVKLEQPPTAIFASNDDMAAATVAVAHRSSMDVPADLTVCGFDDTLLATAIWPALTTVRRPVREMTRAALLHIQNMLVRSRSGVPLETQQIRFDHRLIRRQSDAAPRRRPST
jgi:LacI family transcriptional regulator